MSSAAEGRRPTEASPSSPQGSFDFTAFLISNLHGFLTIMIQIFNEHFSMELKMIVRVCVFVCACVCVCVCVQADLVVNLGADKVTKEMRKVD